MNVYCGEPGQRGLQLHYMTHEQLKWGRGDGNTLLDVSFVVMTQAV